MLGAGSHAWSPATSFEIGQDWSEDATYLQFDLGSVQCITGIVTKGRGIHLSENHAVTAYRVTVSTDGTSYQHVGAFRGLPTTSTETERSKYLASSVRARYVRVIPLAWNVWALRADVLGMPGLIYLCLFIGGQHCLAVRFAAPVIVLYCLTSHDGREWQL